MPAQTQWWCCPNCELLCPIDQQQCGACGEYRGDDMAALTIQSVYRFLADAFFFKPEPK